MQRIALSVLCLLVSMPAYTASFNCKKAASQIEKTICSDGELSQLDEEMASAYRTALKDSAHADSIRQSQRFWLQQTKGCVHALAAGVGNCVKTQYQQRIVTLKLGIATVPAGKLVNGRNNHTATLLRNGKVLLAGGEGDDEDGPFNSAEIYDPDTNRFSVTGSLVDGRSEHSAVLLPNGQVLVTGGEARYAAGPHAAYKAIAQHELYDPASGSFRVAPNIPDGTPVSLENGKVLFINPDSAKLYDPVSGQVTIAGNPVSRRAGGYTTTLLLDRKVLITGGTGQGGIGGYFDFDSAELYDPATNQFTATGSLSSARAAHVATLLPDGNVLITGGNFMGASLTKVELYDVKSGRFSPAGNLVIGRFGHSACLLPNGKVLIAGGQGGNNGEPYLGALELYNPATNTSSLAGGTSFKCYSCTATLLGNGKVLLVNGGTAELYDWAAAK